MTERGRDGVAGQTGTRGLRALAVGSTGTVARIVANDPGRLVKLSSLGLMPGARVRLVQKRPAVVLQIGETVIALDPEVAAAILIESV